MMGTTQGEKEINAPIAVVGTGDLAYSVATCLLKASYEVGLSTDNASEAEEYHENYLEGNDSLPDKLQIDSKNGSLRNCQLIIVINSENFGIKSRAINTLEKVIGPDVTIAINTESIALNLIQEKASHPARIIGLNWTEPAHTTRFLEIITNELVSPAVKKQIDILAVRMKKDAYTVTNSGVRSRLMSALIREAFYLVEKGYASVEDIDRACRNDAGYYLPFAGNCRYMDLMGTYAYGMVMKDLNPDLSRARELPAFFSKIISDGGQGMLNRHGLYEYTTEEVKNWKKVFNEFSQQIANIIERYPFGAAL